MRVCCVMLLVAALFGGCDDDPAPSSTPIPETYQPMDEGALRAAIEGAKRRAREADKRVLLEFGADWCPDCREVLRLSHLAPAEDVLAESYETVVIDVGHFDRHTELIERYGIDRIATLVVLDGEGERVAQTTLEPISGDAEGLTAAALAGWLRDPRDAWQP